MYGHDHPLKILSSMLDVRLQAVAGYMELAMVLEEDEEGMF